MPSTHKTHNPRGYAFVALNRSYNRVQGWNWGAAMRSANIMPEKVDFIEQGLYMWDRMSLDIDTTDEQEVRELTAVIVKSLVGSLKTSSAGRLDYRDAGAPNYRVNVKYNLADSTYDLRATEATGGLKAGNVTDFRYGMKEHVERGYAEYEAHDTVLHLMEHLRTELTAKQYAVVEAHVALDGGTHADVGRLVGTSAQAAYKMWKSVQARLRVDPVAQALR